jgi:endonuclease V-like protein UPF0215 family
MDGKPRPISRETCCVTRKSKAVNKTANTFVAGTQHGRVQVRLLRGITYVSLGCGFNYWNFQNLYSTQKPASVTCRIRFPRIDVMPFFKFDWFMNQLCFVRK